MASISRFSDTVARYETVESARALTTYVLGLALHRGDTNSAELAVDHVRRTLGARATGLAYIEKAATAGMMTGDPGLDYLAPLATAWADLVRRQSLIGRMIGVRRVIAATPVTVVDSGVAAGFVTEGAPIPVVRPVLTDVTLMPGKIALITPYSLELARASQDRAATLIERDQSRAIALAEDVALLDGGAAVSGGRPASILNGVTPITGSDVEALVLALLAAVRQGNPVAPYFLTSLAGARKLSGLRHATNGARLFPNVGLAGGDLVGVPLLVSAGAPAALLTLVDADGLLVVDDDLRITLSTQSGLQFRSDPQAGPQNLLSLFQADMFALRSERFIGWRVAYSDAVAAATLP